jgi:hypothetical protein
MKKLSSLIGGFVTLAVLTGCGSQTAATFAPMQETTPVVSTQSTQGLKSFYSLLTEKVFVSLDTNKDKSISFDEFKARGFMTPGFSSAPATVPQPVTTQGEAPKGEIEPNKAPAPTDTLQTFLRIDANKNGRISMAEAKASKYFLGVSAVELRKMFVPLFNNFDADKNKSISKVEFLKAINGLDQLAQQNMVSLFFTADRNVDSKLTFSEYEDLIYASMKAMWEVPNPAPAQPDPNPPATSVPAQPDPNPPASSDPAQPNQPAQPVPAN